MKYVIKITDVFSYTVEIDAKSKAEAISKAKKYYEVAEDGYVGVADACSHESTRFKSIPESKWEGWYKKIDEEQ